MLHRFEPGLPRRASHGLALLGHTAIGNGSLARLAAACRAATRRRLAVAAVRRHSYLGHGVRYRCGVSGRRRVHYRCAAGRAAEPRLLAAGGQRRGGVARRPGGGAGLAVRSTSTDCRSAVLPVIRLLPCHPAQAAKASDWPGPARSQNRLGRGKPTRRIGPAEADQLLLQAFMARPDFHQGGGVHPTSLDTPDCPGYSGKLIFVFLPSAGQHGLRSRFIPFGARARRQILLSFAAPQARARGIRFSLQCPFR